MLDVLNKDVPKIEFFQEIYKHVPKFNGDDECRGALQNYDLDVRFLQTIDDVSRTYDYATKHVCKFKVTYGLKDLNEFEASSKRKNHITSINDDDHFLMF